jgi:cobaltochelatase CobS
MTASDDLAALRPDTEIAARDFGVNSEMMVPAFSQHSEYVPDRDESYRFDPDTTLAIRQGFATTGA